jgi:hypothetical protein
MFVSGDRQPGRVGAGEARRLTARMFATEERSSARSDDTGLECAFKSWRANPTAGDDLEC